MSIRHSPTSLIHGARMAQHGPLGIGKMPERLNHTPLEALPVISTERLDASIAALAAAAGVPGTFNDQPEEPRNG